MFRTTDFVETALVHLHLYGLPECKHVTVKIFRVGIVSVNTCRVVPLTRPWKPEYCELFIGVLRFAR